MVYNKVIRDRIPEIIEKSGNSANVKELSDSEFLIELENKLVEELEEYRESKSVEELADMVEVIYRILQLRGTTLEDFEKIRLEKAEKRGAFNKNLFLIDTKKD